MAALADHDLPPPSARPASVVALVAPGRLAALEGALDRRADRQVQLLACRSVAELVARLRLATGDRAVIADAACTELDRDLLAEARRSRAPVVVIVSPGGPIDWRALGAAAIASTGEPERAIALALHLARQHGSRRVRAGRVGAGGGGTSAVGGETEAPIHVGDARQRTGVPRAWEGEWPGGPCRPVELGSLIVVSGAPSAAAGAAVVLADAAGSATEVVLADLTRSARMDALHDVAPRPCITDLAHAHQRGVPRPVEVRDGLPRPPGRRYRFVAGLRHPGDWATFGPRTAAAAIDTLRRGAGAVVVAVDPDLEGEEGCGSTDVEDRHQLARLSVAAADLLVLVSDRTPQGLHDHALLHGEVERRRRPGSVILATTVREVTSSPTDERRGAGRALEGSPLGPAAWGAFDRGDLAPLPGRALAPAVVARARSVLTAGLAEVVGSVPALVVPTPVPIAPGELGHWADSPETSRSAPGAQAPGGSAGWTTPSSPQQP